MTATDERHQHLRALRKANGYRTKRSRLKREIHAGSRPVGSVLRAVPAYAETMPVGQLLAVQMRWGQKRAGRFLAPLQINPHRELGRLTKRQRALIAAELR